MIDFLIVTREGWEGNPPLLAKTQTMKSTQINWMNTSPSRVHLSFSKESQYWKRHKNSAVIILFPFYFHNCLQHFWWIQAGCIWITRVPPFHPRLNSMKSLPTWWAMSFDSEILIAVINPGKLHPMLWNKSKKGNYQVFKSHERLPWF